MTDPQNAAYKPAALVSAVVLGLIALGLLVVELVRSTFTPADSWLVVVVLGMVAVVVMQLRARGAANR